MFFNRSNNWFFFLFLTLGIISFIRSSLGAEPTPSSIQCSSHGLYNAWGPLETEINLTAKMDAQGQLKDFVLTLDRREVFNQILISASGRDSSQRWIYALGVPGHGSWSDDSFALQLPRHSHHRDSVDGRIEVTLSDGEKFEGTLSCH